LDPDAAMQQLKAYTNYREYLRDAYQELKSRDPGFSYRRLAEAVGFKTAGFFTRILKGEKNISEDMAARFARFLKLGPKDADFFRKLVRFNQARTHEEKKDSLNRLLNGKYPWLKETGAHQYRFYEKWYYPLIREILNTFPFRGDYRKLARTVVPAISPAEAQEAVRFLEENGFIRRNADGGYYLVDRFLNAGTDIAALSIHTFQMATMDLAKKALERFPPAERDISTLTLSLSRQGASRMKARLAEFRSDLLEIAKSDGKVDQVYQLNFQIFPVSGRMGDEA
jgi:uncharacterized protein (TIGR02147 family)